jgi:hypothetical protein
VVVDDVVLDVVDEVVVEGRVVLVVVDGRVVEVLLLVELVVVALRSTMDFRVVGHFQMVRGSVVAGHGASALRAVSGRSAVTEGSSARTPIGAISRTRPLSSWIGRLASNAVGTAARLDGNELSSPASSTVAPPLAKGTAELSDAPGRTLPSQTTTAASTSSVIATIFTSALTDRRRARRRAHRGTLWAFLGGMDIPVRRAINLLR